MLRSESEVQHLQGFQADANFKAVNMHTVKIHTFNPKNQTKDFDLYILCKGLNSGHLERSVKHEYQNKIKTHS